VSAPTPKQSAKQIIDVWLSEGLLSCARDSDLIKYYEASLEKDFWACEQAALQSARRAAIEEAALVCRREQERCADGAGSALNSEQTRNHYATRAVTADNLEQAIRSLAAPEKP